MDRDDPLKHGPFRLVCRQWYRAYHGCGAIQRHLVTMDPVIWSLNPRKRYDSFLNTPDNHVDLTEHPNYLTLYDLLERHDKPVVGRDRDRRGKYDWFRLHGDYVLAFLGDEMIAIYKHPARLEFHASIVIPDRGGTYYQRGDTMFGRPRIKVAHHRIFVHLGPRYPILVYDFDGNQITTIPNTRTPPWKIIDKWVVTESRVLLYTRGGNAPTWVTTLDGEILGETKLYCSSFKSSTASNIVIDPYRAHQHYMDISDRSIVSGLIGREYSSRKRYLDSLLGFHVMIGNHHIAIKESDESPGITNIRTFEVGGRRTEWISLPARFNTVTRVGEFVLLYNPQHEQVHVYRLQPRYRYSVQARVVLDPSTRKKTVARADPYDLREAALQRVAIIPTEGSMRWGHSDSDMDGFATITGDSELWCLRVTPAGPMLHRYFRGFQAA